MIVQIYKSLRKKARIVKVKYDLLPIVLQKHNHFLNKIHAKKDEVSTVWHPRVACSWSDALW